MMNRAKKLAVMPLTLVLLLTGYPDVAKAKNSEEQARQIVSQMTLKEKIAQKLMMSFRLWCSDDEPNCTDPLTEINPTVAHIIRDDKIGGVILFRENLPDLETAAKLIWDMQNAVSNHKPLGLFMALDQEGGNVVRLPRAISTNMPGNMALGAAYLATQDPTLAYQEGKVLAAEAAAVGFNFDMAPVVDVQNNPLNPVINVRAFSEDPDIVGTLGENVSQGIESENVISAMKHFPGHGNTKDDSHTSLPRVDKSSEYAHNIDLKPYLLAIESGNAPDAIMTAHIQYPALDDSLITTKEHTQIIKPATLSYHIQTELLRDEMGYRGVTITDALNMQGITNYFDQETAVLDVFKAGVDIALIPTELRTAKEADKVSKLIDAVAAAVNDGQLSESALNQSVQRIVQLKIERNIVNQNGAVALKYTLNKINKTVGSQAHKAVESEIVDHSITLVKDKLGLPISASDLGKIHILTPWQEQGTAMKQTFIELGIQPDDITAVKMSQTDWQTEKAAIDNADTIIVGTLTSGIKLVKKNATPNADTTSIDNNQFARYALEYASANAKNTILVSMRSPYDIALYHDVADTIIATYSYYGFDYGALRGPSVVKVPDFIMGTKQPLGKLPVTVKNVNSDGSIGDVLYPMGYSAP
jgi:beta-N-acetylhexosaminidase